MSITVSPATVGTNSTQTVTFTGTGTSWTSATTFTLSSVSTSVQISAPSGYNVASQVWHYTLNGGTTVASVQVRNSTDGLVGSFDVVDPSMTASPGAATTGVTSTLTVTGSYTSWTTAVPPRISVTGGTGTSFTLVSFTQSTQTVVGTLTPGSTPATLTVLDSQYGTNCLNSVVVSAPTPSFTLSPTSSSNTQTVVTATGTNTSWTSGTTFTAPVALSAQSMNVGSQIGTFTLDKGSASGSQVISNTTDAGTSNFTVFNPMGQTYFNNFDALTVGSLPTGWTVPGPGGYAVTTTHPASGLNTFGGDTDHGIALYTANAVSSDQSGQWTQFPVEAHIPGGTGADSKTGLVLRSDSTGQNCLIVLPYWSSEVGAYGGVLVLKYVSGGLSNDTAAGFPINYFGDGTVFQQNDLITFKAEIQGSTVRVRAWLYNTPEPSGWFCSYTTSTTFGPGYQGLYQSCPNPGTGYSSVDDLYLGTPGTMFGPSFTVSPTTASTGSNVTITVTGTSTNWLSGTTFSVTGGTGASISGTSVNVGAQTATFVLHPGTSAGALVIGDSADPAQATVTVGASATFTISPTSGAVSTTPTITATGSNTSWLSGTTFSVTGGASPTITGLSVNAGAQTATMTLHTSTSPGTLTLHDSVDSATANFTVTGAAPTTKPTVAEWTSTHTNMVSRIPFTEGVGMPRELVSNQIGKPSDGATNVRTGACPQWITGGFSAAGMTGPSMRVNSCSKGLLFPGVGQNPSGTPPFTQSCVFKLASAPPLVPGLSRSMIFANGSANTFSSFGWGISNVGGSGSGGSGISNPRYDMIFRTGQGDNQIAASGGSSYLTVGHWYASSIVIYSTSGVTFRLYDLTTGTLLTPALGQAVGSAVLPLTSTYRDLILFFDPSTFPQVELADYQSFDGTWDDAKFASYCTDPWADVRGTSVPDGSTLLAGNSSVAPKVGSVTATFSRPLGGALNSTLTYQIQRCATADFSTTVTNLATTLTYDDTSAPVKVPSFYRCRQTDGTTTVYTPTVIGCPIVGSHDCLWFGTSLLRQDPPSVFGLGAVAAGYSCNFLNHAVGASSTLSLDPTQPTGTTGQFYIDGVNDAVAQGCTWAHIQHATNDGSDAVGFRSRLAATCVDLVSRGFKVVLHDCPARIDPIYEVQVEALNAVLDGLCNNPVDLPTLLKGITIFRGDTTAQALVARWNDQLGSDLEHWNSIFSHGIALWVSTNNILNPVSGGGSSSGGSIFGSFIRGNRS